MPQSIEGRAAYTGSRNVAVADVSNDAHAIPDIPPPAPPPPSSYHRSLGAQLRPAPTLQRKELVADAALEVSSVENVAPQAVAPQAPEATDEAATIATLRRRWPAWLTMFRLRKRLPALPRLRVKRQWLIAASIALVAALVGWSIGAKPWLGRNTPKPVAASLQAKGKNSTKLTGAAARGQSAAKQSGERTGSTASPKLANTAKASAPPTRRAFAVTGKAQTKTQKNASKPLAKSSATAKKSAYAGPLRSANSTK